MVTIESRDILNVALMNEEMSQRQLALSLGISPQSLNTRFVNSSFKVDDLTMFLGKLGYRMVFKNIGGDEVYTIAEVDDMLEQKKKHIPKRVNVLIELMESYGCRVMLEQMKNGKYIDIDAFLNRSRGPHVRMMCNRVIYDTWKSVLIASTEYADGENRYDKNGAYEQLFVDAEGRYFITEFHEGEAADFITPISANLANLFIREYGTKPATDGDRNAE